MYPAAPCTPGRGLRGRYLVSASLPLASPAAAAAPADGQAAVKPGAGGVTSQDRVRG